MTEVVILAAGKGVRMGSELPKVLTVLGGKPIITYLLDAVNTSGVCARPTIVIGYKEVLVKATLGQRYRYVQQTQQLGTGHALSMCESVLKGVGDNVLVLYGDHPFVSSETIQKLAHTHEQRGTVLTMVTTTVENFTGWQKTFDDFGRIIRDEFGHVVSDVEKKDSTAEIREIREVNIGFYCFQSHWLWDSLHALTTNNASNEYYLTDLLASAIHGGHTISTISVDPREAFGINTPEQLVFAQELLKNS